MRNVWFTVLSFAPTDVSLTDRNIDQMLTEVVDWHTLGKKLELPVYTLDKIRIDCSTYGTDRQRQEMISKWLAYDTEASWSKLASALEEMANNKVAAKIWSQYTHGYKGKCVCLHVFVCVLCVWCAMSMCAM